MTRHRLSMWWLCAWAALVACLTLSASERARASGSASSLYASPLDRFGINVVTRYGQITDYDVARLGARWYSDWWYSPRPARPGGIEYVQLVSGDSALNPAYQQGLAQAIANNPGALWLVGNEPDQVGQDNLLPAAYARVYHDIYHFVKGRDPTARLSAGGIVQPTPLRLQWLDMVLHAYWQLYGVAMPVDVWNIHNQILREDRNLDGGGCGIPPGIEADQGKLYSVYDNASVDIFRQHILAFRSWMRAHGQREKPLIISEYGVLMPSSYLGGGDPVYGDTVVTRYMEQTFDYLLTAVDDQLGCPADGNRLVQRWAWFSLNGKIYDRETGLGYNGALYDWRYPTYPGILTGFGQTYEAYTSRFFRQRMYLPSMHRQIH